MTPSYLHLQAAIKLAIQHIADWSEHKNWQYQGTRKRALWEILTKYYDLKGANRKPMTLPSFYAATNGKHDASLLSLHGIRIYEKIRDLLLEHGWVLDENTQAYVPIGGSSFPNLVRFDTATLKKTFAMANPHLVVVQTFLDNILQIHEPIFEAVRRQVSVEIYLVDPNCDWAVMRNQPPHPFSGIDIPEQVRQNQTVLLDTHSQLGYPENFKLYFYQIPTPNCIYKVSNHFYVSPFYAHQFATDTLFQRFTYPDHPFADLFQQEYEHLNRHSFLASSAA